ncbi:hypothetical protein [Streptomyces sp. Ru87]|uniref:hypothetical protein n=1 Tax=Streptomyces sp. Ru87 TaxID=2044307 RepID=UPI000BF71AB2|nr:hypothetical protein [Streptomyces sp. Ru87]PGH49206.1 hypothetical protein CRI70_18995 [Streptomyces sp. Ru87]
MPFGDGVADFGRGGLTVGRSGDQATYWLGTEGHPVPPGDGTGTLSVQSSTLTAVNGNDVMTGKDWTIDGGTRSYTYRLGDPAVTWLPAPTTDSWDATDVHAEDINDRGQVVGYDGLARKAYVWRNGGMVRELTPPAGVTNAEAHAVNNKGAIVGRGQALAGDGTPSGWVLLLWPSGGGPADILGPTGYGQPDIDERGRVVATMPPDATTGLRKAVHWDRPYTAGAVEVDGLAAFAGSGSFRGISPSSRLVAGTAFNPADPGRASQAQVWPGHGPVLALPPLEPGTPSQATAASDNGSVGGYAEQWGVDHPVIWTCALEQGYRPE